MNKVVKSILIIFVVVSSFLVGFVLSNVRNNNVKDELIKISVVNNDIGVEIDNNEIYYSDYFINNVSKDSDIKLTSLSMAKESLKRGDISGYIVIPETFSKDVASINTSRNKPTIVYDFDGSNKKIVDKFNQLFLELDNSVSENKLLETFEDANMIINHSKEMVSTIKENDVKINGINPTSWFKPISLQEAKIISINDKELREYLNNLGLIEVDVNSQLENMLSDNNEPYSDLQLTYTNMEGAIQDAKVKRYVSYTTNSLPLVYGYNLKSSSQVNVVLDKETSELFVKSSGDLKLDNGIDNINLVQQVSDNYISVLELNNQVAELVSKNNVQTIYIGEDVIYVFGKEITVNKELNNYIISGASKISVNNQVYYPNNDGKIIISVDDNNNEYDRSIAYNKISAQIITDLRQQLTANPNIGLREAIDSLNQTTSSIYEENFAIIGVENNVVKYFNEINPEIFLRNVMERMSNDVNLQTNNNYALPTRKINIVESGNIQPNYDISLVPTKIVNIDEIQNFDLIETNAQALSNNFNILATSIVSGVDYEDVYENINNINKSTNEIIKSANNDVKENEKIISDNQENVRNNFSLIEENAINEIDSLKSEVSQNNKTIIDVNNEISDNINYVRNGNTVDKEAINFVASPVEYQLSNGNVEKPNRRKNNTINNVIGVGLVGGIVVMCGLIYKQRKKGDE